MSSTQYLPYHLRVILFSLVFFVGSPVMADISLEERAATYKQLEIFSHVLSILQENYVEEIESQEVLNGAIRGLLFSLDPHSSYLPAESFKDLQQETSGSFSGIGIEVTIKNELLTIVSPIAETPADRAGLKANDIIIEINGVSTKNLGPYQAIKKLRGPVGSEVSISIHREGWDDLKTVTLTREIIPIQSVKAEFLSPGFVYTRITNFQSRTTSDFKASLKKLKKQHPIKGLILDLRNNPGGLLNQAISISDIFLESGTIVYTKGRRKDQNNIYSAHTNGEKRMYPLVLLVNEGSASASEIVAGAIQAHKRGVVVGTKTFGKGSVQTIIPLPDGAGLRMTTAKYYTPDDRSIQALGITPDVEIPFVPCNSPVTTNNKKKLLKEVDLAGHLPSTKVETDESEAMKAQAVAKLEERLKLDNQLRSAYNIAKSLNLFYEYKQTTE